MQLAKQVHVLAARTLVGAVWTSWHRDHAGSMGAALAYYTLFSLAPLLLIVISLAGLAFGDAAARGEIQSQLDTLMGPGSARAVQDLLASVRQPAQGVFATLLGLLLLVAGAVSVFGELQNALDRIWHVPEEATARSWPMLLRIRLLPYGMILALSFLLMVSLLLSAMLAALGHSLGRQLAEWEGVIRLGNIGSGFVLAALVFGLIFKVVPRVHVHWKDVWVGAGFTAALFELGKSLIGWYIGRTGAASGFGAAGSLVVVLLWVYWSAQILLLGAEFTWAYANLFGSRRPAVPGGTTDPVSLARPARCPADRPDS